MLHDVPLLGSKYRVQDKTMTCHIIVRSEFLR